MNARKFLFVAFFAGTSLIATAQRSDFIMDGVSGSLYKSVGIPGVNGSPFLFEDWVPGTLFMKDGGKASKFLLKYDLYNNEILFLHENKTLAVANPVIDFILSPSSSAPMRFRSGFAPVERNTAATFYQVVEDGSVMLLKHVYKTIVEVSEYNKASTLKEFSQNEVYYIARPGLPPVRIKKDKASLLQAIGDKDGKLAAWVEKKRLRCKSEEDIIEVVKAVNAGTYQ